MVCTIPTAGMLITAGSRVEGQLRVYKPTGPNEGRPPRIVIGPDTEIVGDMVFDRPVRLFVHRSAQVGSIDGAVAETFSGDRPDES